MSEITPRWEWRSFGPRFGGAEKRLAALTPRGVQESDEVYLLSAAGDNVKVRVELGSPIALDANVRFAIREGGRTVGSGVVTKILK